nr:hypothetical protein [Acinetobacter johnsonii]
MRNGIFWLTSTLNACYRALKVMLKNGQSIKTMTSLAAEHFSFDY